MTRGLRWRGRCDDDDHDDDNDNDNNNVEKPGVDRRAGRRVGRSRWMDERMIASNATSAVADIWHRRCF